MIPPLERFASNPIVTPSQISFVRASGAFNPAATIDRDSGRVVLLVRVFEEETKRSCLALALSSDGERFEMALDKPAITHESRTSTPTSFTRSPILDIRRRVRAFA
jgi:predicted GH43/DUF377 family glycosyl hydrolase